MQRLGDGVGTVIAEEHRAAPHRRHLQACVGEHRGPPSLGRVQVHHQRAHALAATLQDLGCAGLGGVEIVVVRLVLRARAVAQDLQALAPVQRPVHQGGDASLDAVDQRGLPALEEHAVAGARGVHLAAARGGVHGFGACQARGRLRHQFFALLVGQQVAEDHHPRQTQRHHHFHRMTVDHDDVGAVVDLRFGHAGAARHRFAQAGEVAPQGLLQGVQRHVFMPAAGHHGLDHVFGYTPRLGLGDDPAAQLGGDLLDGRGGGGGLGCGHVDSCGRSSQGVGQFRVSPWAGAGVRRPVDAGRPDGCRCWPPRPARSPRH